MADAISSAIAERAAAEGVVAQAFGVTFHALRADGRGGCLVDRQRGITETHERVILAAGAAWDGDTAVDGCDPRCLDAAKFILADPKRQEKIRRLAERFLSHGAVHMSGYRLPAEDDL